MVPSSVVRPTDKARQGPAPPVEVGDNDVREERADVIISNLNGQIG
ncbi:MULTISPECIES: hypothetical protein [Arthrobacter]|nr:hypothetical protein [Arthrobacter sp. H35-MC1]MDJ0317411.1 hypothetical protein [Arthrobacter sp. H35-MC1]